MESVFLLKNTYRTNSKWKKRKYCEKKKKKKENREATLNISNNSPRIFVAEKNKTKKKHFSA
jgi:hypothetical protein